MRGLRFALTGSAADRRPFGEENKLLPRWLVGIPGGVSVIRKREELS
jgi:hypothetical protein